MPASAMKPIMERNVMDEPMMTCPQIMPIMANGIASITTMGWMKLANSHAKTT